MIFPQSDEIDAIREGRWEIACPEMTLTREDNTESWRGSGFVRRTPDVVLGFQLIAPNRPDAMKEALTTYFSGFCQDRFLLDEKHFFRLNCIDRHNRTWSSSRFRMPSFCAGEYPGLVIVGQIPSISCKEASDTPNEVKRPPAGASSSTEGQASYLLDLWAFPDFEIPTTHSSELHAVIAGEEQPKSFKLNVSRTVEMGLGFTLVRNDGSVHLSCRSEAGPRPPLEHLDVRVTEALQFMLGQPVEWDVLWRWSAHGTETIVRSWPRKSRRAKVGPPLAFNAPKHNESVWCLFGRYLRYIVVLPKSTERFCLLSERFWDMLQGSTGTWEAQILALCIGIEGLVHDFFSSTPPPEKMVKTADAAIALLDNAKRNEQFAADEECMQALRTVIGNLKSRRSTLNILRTLAVGGVVDADDVSAWDTFRNPAAHGVLNFEVTEDTVRQRNALLCLFYDLVFHIIGYSGPCSDYRRPDTPLRMYGEGLKGGR